ncbi:hypothetical protein BT96DRAFT_983682 [Gymnopus androsaceus JB14]|uniref:F-box domain-containing protein n=1 Tax=Gymnopus androsaceus JB14 TaxID=1447944 RepID=A0A6A4IS21_9AGAR|nr:hypothetical protein BT96DRAFT_983682 [Gymnopus androsaceus JB14]
MNSTAPRPFLTLRLSGDCEFPKGTKLPSLTTLTIDGVTGYYSWEEHFADSPLKTFQYKDGDKEDAQFPLIELQDHRLKSLVFGSASGIHDLVLLGCRRVSSTTLSSCLRNLGQLRYLAISFVYVNELDSNFVAAFLLPSWW